MAWLRVQAHGPHAHHRVARPEAVKKIHEVGFIRLHADAHYLFEEKLVRARGQRALSHKLHIVVNGAAVEKADKINRLIFDRNLGVLGLQLANFDNVSFLCRTSAL